VKRYNWLLVSLSAVIYHVATLGFLSLPLMFFSFVLLACCSHNSRTSLRYQVLWGIVFFVCHFACLFPALNILPGTFQINIAILGLIVACTVFYLACWFWLVNRMFVWAGSSERVRLAGLFVMGWAMWWWLSSRYLFALFHPSMGYPFVNPLITFIDLPSMLGVISWSGELVLLFALMTICWCCSRVLRDQSLMALLVGTFALLLFLVGPCVRLSVDKTTFVPDLHCTGVVCVPDLPLHDAVESLCRLLDQIAVDNPACRLVVAPESTIKAPINLYSSCIDKIAMHLEGRVLLLGAHKSVAGNLYNCMYLMNRSGIIWSGSKSVLLPAFEKSVYGLFLSKNRLCAARGAKTCCPIAQYRYVPLICSEFLLEIAKINLDDADGIVTIINDSWFAKTAYVGWFRQYARYRSIRDDIPVLYCSHTTTAMFMPLGNKLLFTTLC
jgi:apolipoprotein N-acyltransferase